MARAGQLGNTSAICREEVAMTFGKRGRPPEDRLARQREIYHAVSPLILRDGARRLSMRQAARAACLSVGGLYHYFPTKRDLVLHGLCPEALLRVCQDFHAQSGQLADLDPQRYLDEGIGVIVEHVSLCRPAIHAALELGADSFWGVIDTLLTNSAIDFEVHLRRLYPEVSEQDLQQWGRAIRRAICAALLDKSVPPDELRDELRTLVDGYVVRIGRAGHALAAAPVGTEWSIRQA
jgi:AcrR family transcriptional regulator